ncbi:cytoglobin-2-like [Ruditapes philippinarum]|uniref:cytoglobin-2-like n=1 Tax=Ruditapes philippinarum TaxID=129788 RepID=UPI00295AED3A|nr:cytoglobin-2-like [Ruditapes philippinarum]
MGCVCDGIKLRCSRKIEPKEDDREGPPTWTQDEISVLQNNWQVLKLHLANIGVNTFISLFESKPELKDLFKQFRGKDLKILRFTSLLRKHAKRVMATLEKCVLHLDDPASVIPSLTKLGKVHAKSKVPDNYLELILPFFLNSIKPYIEEFWCSALEDAWSKVFIWMTFHIREGMVKYDKR